MRRIEGRKKGLGPALEQHARVGVVAGPDVQDRFDR
jgi:hypothetical protein